VRTLKKHSVYHSDQRLLFHRPNLLAETKDAPPVLGVVPYMPMHQETEDWRSRVAFLRGFNAVFTGKKLMGFAQFVTKVVSQETHEKAMDLARRTFHKLEVDGKPLWHRSNHPQVACRVRDFIREVYIGAYKQGYFESTAFLKDAKTVLQRDPLCEDALSQKLIEQVRLLGLFRYSDAPPYRPRTSWMDAQLREASEKADVGPGSYDPGQYDALGSIWETERRGKSISQKFSEKPNTVPGPGHYTPQEPQADKKIPPHYLEPVGGTILEQAMQELVACWPATVNEAKHWLETAAPSNGLQVQLLKQYDWVDTAKVGSPLPRPPKTPRSPGKAASKEDTGASGSPVRRKHATGTGPGSSQRVFLIVGAKEDLDRVLGKLLE